MGQSEHKRPKSDPLNHSRNMYPVSFQHHIILSNNSLPRLLPQPSNHIPIANKYNRG